MRSPVVARVFRLAGVVRPEGVLARTFARGPRERLVRAVAWYARAMSERIAIPEILAGVRLVLRGWDDVYARQVVARDAPRADAALPVADRALVIRRGRAGRGWEKDPLPTVGRVRPEIDLAVRWLTTATGCIVHDDCAAIPELGAACAEAQRESLSRTG